MPRAQERVDRYRHEAEQAQKRLAMFEELQAKTQASLKERPDELEFINHLPTQGSFKL